MTLDNSWSSEPVSGTLLYPRQDIKVPLEGRALNSLGALAVAKLLPGGVITITDEFGLELGVVTVSSCVWLDFCFDQLDRFVLTWETQEGECMLHWYDPVISQYAQKLIGNGQNPCCCINDPRIEFLPESDILVFRQYESELLYRMQRDRYDIEYTVPITQQDLSLNSCGFSSNLRLIVRLVAANAILITSGGTEVTVDGYNMCAPTGTSLWPTSSSNTKI